MLRFISKLIFKITGWKTVGEIPKNIKKYVIITAPHTSNWDFVIGRLAFSIFKLNGYFIIKKELFFLPLNIILKLFNAIPVDRKKGDIVHQVVNYFNKYDNFCIIITPEGTRKAVKKWKEGFYMIATAAKVPIVIGYLDYKKKEIGFKDVFYPTGNKDIDIKKIQSYYKGLTAKYPNNFILPE